jgi:hypothetical protein
MPIHAHHGAERLEPKGICQAPEPLVAAIMVDNRLADQRSETGHSIGQPLWHMPAMKRQISAARSLCHHSPCTPLAALLRSSGASEADRSGRFFDSGSAGLAVSFLTAATGQNMTFI